MYRKLLLIVLLVVMTVAVSVPGLSQDNTLVLARAIDSTGLDPHTQTAFASIRLLELIYEPLVTTDAELNVIPALATDWTFSDDGMTLTFNLREGVTFHDGSTFTAEDVIASYERLLDEETASAARTNYLSIESMDAPDDLTVVFNLNTSDVPLLAAMTSINAAILSSDVVSNEDPALVTAGTGPFKLDSWTPDEVTMLSANADWWGEGPFVDGIEIRIIPDETSILAALRAGTVDFAVLEDSLVASLLIDDSEVTLNQIGSLDYNVLQLRASVEPLDMIEVRQAISCAINRQEIVDTVALGFGKVTGPLTMASYALPVEDLFCYEQDVERAKELMATAGMEDGFTLPIMVSNTEPPEALPIAQVLQSQLAEININVELDPVEFSNYVDRWLGADFTAAVARNGGRIDPYTMYSRYWQVDARFQDTAGYIDDTLDTLMKAGQVETDPDARYAIFAELQQHLAETSPWIWLYTNNDYTAHQSSVVGWEPIANDSLYFLSGVSLER